MVISMPNSECFHWSHGLNGQALRIARAEESPLRVLAGPGTGKTFSLMRRIARIIDEGTSPERILVCTFTRTAAKDLQSELRRLGAAGCSSVIAGTLHSFCYRALNRAGVYELIGRIPRALLEFEKRFLLEDLKRGNFGTINQMKKAIQAFNASWARLQHEEPGWPVEVNDRLFHEAIIDWLAFHQAMLIGEIIPETLRYFRLNPLAEELSQFSHVLVDEYQDLNRAEQVLLDHISSNGSLTVIGDEDQSIYSFKCAHPMGISHFEDYHAETTTETLTDCRRCPHLVVNLANSLISHNRSRAQRQLVPFDGNSLGQVLVVQWGSIEEEATGIARFIKTKIESGEVDPGRILVLSPIRQIAQAIRESLSLEGIPSLSFFQEELLDGNPSKVAESYSQQSMCLLKLIVNPDDRVALRCWCGFGSPTLNSRAWDNLITYSKDNSCSPRVALDRLASGQIQISYTSPVIERYRLLLSAIEDSSRQTGADFIEWLFPSGNEWADPFRYLLRDIATDNVTPESVLDHLQTAVTQPELPTKVDYVRIMSLHKSKGLTSDLVVVAGCVQGLIPRRYNPDKTDLSQSEFDEEQRRLFYVAITRTRNILVLSSVNRISLHDAHRIQAQVVPIQYQSEGRAITSNFISELGPQCPRPVNGRALVE
ncbi:ATP-dependent helicase [Fundidesulfovibrio agrisoli]|uniref:ATP-dependent helicase n=1 Tax=Fundidesulfovibrio agrisoli TaxID=2922717 RepID=UPI00311AB229